MKTNKPDTVKHPEEHTPRRHSRSPLPRAVTSTLQSVLDSAAASRKSPGMIMAVQIGDSRPWIGVTGYQDEARTRKMTPDMTFRVGSITKNFLGTAILQQVDERKLSLDDTLEKWLPRVFSNIDGSGITIRQILSHTSGIESYTDHERWITTVYRQPRYVWKAPQELLALVQELRDRSLAGNRVSPPGSAFRYSNTNGILTGMIAAKVDGYAVTDWYRVIITRFFRRLRLRGSRIPAPGDTEVGSTNRGYVNFHNFLGGDNCTLLNPNCTDVDVDFTYQEMTNAWSAGAIISTAGDLLGWINAEAKGYLLSPDIRKQQQTFLDTGINSIQVGLGMFRQTRYGFIGHRGEVLGFNGTMQYLPERDMSVVVLSNRTALDNNHVGPVPEDVVAALFPEARGLLLQPLEADPPHIRPPERL